MKRILFCLLALALLALQPVSAQVLYGSVVGLAEDPSGSAIPGATVTITNKQTGQTLESVADDSGRYSIFNVLPGTYDLKIAAKGFQAQTRTDIGVTANTVSRVDIRMEVGTVSESVTVQADATLLQTDRSDTHTTLATQAIVNMPLGGYRNYQTLINLVPGATPAAFQNSKTDTPNRALSTNINGTNRNNNMTRIDGAASVNLWLPHHAGYVAPAETIDQVNISTTALNAEQGMAGGAAVTVITKSGTNQLHGSAFEFNNNQHMNARNFFQPAGVDKPLSIYNNFGATLGGPIVKNKLFYFGSWDGTRERTSAVSRYSVPTADQRLGDFSAYTANPIFDPLTGNPDGTGRQQFPGNRIPGNRISPIAQKIQAFYPDPNLPGPTNNYFASGVPLFDRDYVDVKMNYNRNERHAIWGKYGHMSALVIGKPIFGAAGGPAPGADPGTGDTHINNGSLGHTFTFSPTLLLDGVIGYQRMEQSVLGSDFGKNYGLDLGIPGTNGPDIRQSGFPNIVNGYDTTGVPGWMPLFRTEESFTTSHNLNYTHGAHQLRFGFDGVLHRMNHWQPELGAGPRGYINFDGGVTALNSPGAASPNQFNAYAAFLLGLPQQFQKSIQYILMTPREWQFGWYGQDNWQVTRKLTVNLGLRYEFYPLMTRAGGKGIERLDPGTNQVFLGGRGNVPTNVGVTVSHKLFSPRVGIAYRLSEKTVVRTGYGINYDPLPFSRPLRGFYPLTVNFNFTETGFKFFRPLDQGIPPVVGPDLSTGIVDLPNVADMRSPYSGELHRGYIQSWNFTVQRRLPMQFALDAAYVGTQTVHQLADLDINSGFPGSGQAGRPYFAKFGRATATNMWDGYLSSHYHSLQLSLNKQFSKGLLVKGAYTWSKAINMTDDDGWAGVGWNWGPVFSRNRAPSGFDRRHMFVMAWVYELPVGKGKQFVSSGVVSHIIGNWQVNGDISAYTGTPFTVAAPGNALNAPSNSQTADQVKADVQRIGDVGPGTRYYDPTAFAAPTDPRRFGSTGRNIMRNPGVWNTDLSLFRNFPLTERVGLSFRAEFYNLPNTSHFNGPASNNVTNPNFMRILGSYGERQIRLGLRLAF